LFNQFRILKDILGYSVSALGSQALGLLAGLWIARTLGPSDFGIWNAVSLVLAYGAYVEFGVLSTMGRDLPYCLGQRDAEKAASLEGAARWATISGAVLVAAVIIFVSYSPGALFFWPSAVAFLSSQPSMMLTGLRLMAIVLIFQQVYAYHRTVLRAHNLFGELGQQQFLLALITAVLGVAGVVALGLRGRLIAAVIAQGGIVVYALYRNPWRRLAKPHLKTMWTLMRVGIPITISGSIVSLVTTIDRPMVLGFLGSEQLGYLGLAFLVTGTVSLVPAMASQVLYPRITYHFGQSGGDIAALRSFVLRPPLLLACLLPVVIGPVFLALPVLIRIFLPAFSPGIMAARIVVVGIFFYSILGLTDYFLVTTGKLKQYALFGCGALALNVTGDYIALRLGYGIEGVAFTGTPLTYFVYSSVVIAYALSHYELASGEWLRYFARLWSPFLYMVALLWVVETLAHRWIVASTPLGLGAAVTAQIVFYLVGMVPLIMLAARELKLKLSWTSLTRVQAGH